LLDLGTPPHAVQEIVGHSAIEVTMTIYAHVSLDEKRKALRKLGEALGLGGQQPSLIRQGSAENAHLERGAAGTRTQDRRIMSPARQQPVPYVVTWADTGSRDHGCGDLGTHLA
jgi:hypothetical protein